MGKELTLDERKQIQLDMLIEIDAFCREHNIKYALSCGTLIGAIRHKGFIPWDDDVDITMSLDDIENLKKNFISSNIKIIDVESECGYTQPFPRFSHLGTYSKRGSLLKGNGISIDIYPIFPSLSDKDIIEKKIIGASKLVRHFRFIKKWRSRIYRWLPLPELRTGLSNKVTKDYRDYLLTSFYNRGGVNYYQIGGPLNIFYKNYWEFNPLEELIEVDFEDRKFYAPARFDEFLKVRYGDYLKLPPEDQRKPYHICHYYWK